MSIDREAATVRLWIIGSIRRILAGQPFTRQDWEAQPHAGWEEIEPKRRLLGLRLDENPAYFAWTALRWWANDDDIRAEDPEYGDARKRQLEGLLHQIEPPSSTEALPDETVGDHSRGDQDR